MSNYAVKAPALLIAVVLAFQPGIAAAARVIVSVRPSAGMTTGSAAAGAAIKNLSLPWGLNHSFTPTLGATLPSLPAVGVAPSVNSQKAITPSVRQAAASPLKAIKTEAPVSRQTSFTEKVSGIARSVAASVKSLGKASTSNARTGAARQIDILSGVKTRSYTSGAVTATPSARKLGRLNAAKTPLSRLQEAAPSSIEETPQAEELVKQSWWAKKTQIFREKERNRAFWRMFLGEAIYLFGFQMYIVALPFLMKSFTQNNLQGDDLRDTTAEALNALVRENRSLARIAHWTAQAVSYIAIPLFTKDGKAGPKKWLLRSALARMAVLFGVPVIFFASGVFTASTALWVLMGLIAGQSFFQGIYVIMMSGATARLMGHKSVLPSERMRANSMRTFLSALIAIIAPFIAGQIAGMPDWFGKAGTGSAVIYGIYAASVGLAGIVFATIRMLGAKTGTDAQEDASQNYTSKAVKVTGLWGAIKLAGISMVRGVKLVWQNRFLRTLMILGLISSMFADPLIFNVLPEFVEGILATNPGALDSILGIPVIGWFAQGLVGTPMGFFALLVTSSSIGSAVAAVFLKPLRKLFTKIGFSTEERLTIPFYILAFLQVPAFWWMINAGSVGMVLALYGAQTFLAGFVGMIMIGIYQKKIRGYSDLQMNQVLAANSFVSIIAAILATFLYGFILTGIPIATSLWVAGIATTVLGLLRLASPWLLFNKAERKRKHAPNNLPPGPRDGHTPHGHEHLPNGGHGPLNIGL